MTAASSAVITELPASANFYPGTTALINSGFASGDVLIAFAGVNSLSTTTTTLSANNCSNQGNGAQFNNNANGNQGILAWCIANSTSVTFTAGGTTTDCGINVTILHSTTGFSTTVVTAIDNTIAAAATITLTSMNPLGAVNACVGYILDETGTVRVTATAPWTLGPNALGHLDYANYQVGMASGNYTPQFSASVQHTVSAAGVCVSAL